MSSQIPFYMKKGVVGYNYGALIKMEKKKSNLCLLLER